MCSSGALLNHGRLKPDQNATDVDERRSCLHRYGSGRCQHEATDTGHERGPSGVPELCEKGQGPKELHRLWHVRVHLSGEGARRGPGGPSGSVPPGEASRLRHLPGRPFARGILPGASVDAIGLSARSRMVIRVVRSSKIDRTHSCRISRLLLFHVLDPE